MKKKTTKRPAYLYNKTTEDVAKLLGYNVQWVRHLARTNKIPHLKRIRQYLFSFEEIMEHLRTKGTEPCLPSPTKKGIKTRG